jgi:hypothetical protein
MAGPRDTLGSPLPPLAIRPYFDPSSRYLLFLLLVKLFIPTPVLHAPILLSFVFKAQSFGNPNSLTQMNKDNPNQARGRSNFDVTRFRLKQIQEFHLGDRPTNRPTDQPTNEENYRSACSRLKMKGCNKVKRLWGHVNDVGARSMVNSSNTNLSRELRIFVFSTMGVWQGLAMDSLKFHPGPLYPTLLCPVGRPPLKRLFQGWPARRASGLRQSSTPLDTSRCTPMFSTSLSTMQDQPVPVYH